MNINMRRIILVLVGKIGAKSGAKSGTDGTFSHSEIGHLHLNHPFDQLSPRTPTAIFKTGVPTNA